MRGGSDLEIVALKIEDSNQVPESSVAETERAATHAFECADTSNTGIFEWGYQVIQKPFRPENVVVRKNSDMGLDLK